MVAFTIKIYTLNYFGCIIKAGNNNVEDNLCNKNEVFSYNFNVEKFINDDDKRIIIKITFSTLLLRV